MLHTPILPFERGRNQQGLFIYQAYLSFDESTYNTHILSQQRVWPDVVIVIENKEKILNELDFMGINEKLIYGGYDTIARYIKKKSMTNKNGRDTVTYLQSLSHVLYIGTFLWQHAFNRQKLYSKYADTKKILNYFSYLHTWNTGGVRL